MQKWPVVSARNITELSSRSRQYPARDTPLSHDLSIRANPLPEAAVQGSLAVSNELLERVIAGHQGLSRTRNALSVLPDTLAVVGKIKAQDLVPGLQERLSRMIP